MKDIRLEWYKEERKEIRDILKNLTGGAHIYYLLGTARAMKRIENEEKQAEQQTE